jgi:amino acid transporter
MFSYSTLYAGAAAGSLAYLGFYYPVYFAGEVKNVRRTQIISQLGGIIIFAVFTTVVVSVEYFGEGAAFANAMASLWAAGAPEFPYLTTPLASGLSMFWSRNPILVALFNLSYAATIEIFNITVFFTLTRNIFAWSFDRVLPAAFAQVSDRTHTPIVATLPLLIVSVIYTYVTIYQYGILAATFSYGVAGLVIGIAIVAIAAIIYPYTRRDLFKATDPISKFTIRGIPLISIMGVLTVIASVTIVYTIMLPVIGGVNFLTILFEGIIPTFVIGIVLYSISWIVRRRQGMDLTLVKREVPPE